MSRYVIKIVIPITAFFFMVTGLAFACGPWFDDAYLVRGSEDQFLSIPEGHFLYELERIVGYKKPEQKEIDEIDHTADRDIMDLEDLPSNQTTKPAVVFKPHTRKRQLVPYNTERAIELLMRRDTLPLVFKSPADVTEIPRGIIGRSELVIKHESAAHLMRYTRSDEG